nr:unnamed protein product [Spirometra erinaceieuropaei]
MGCCLSVATSGAGVSVMALSTSLTWGGSFQCWSPCPSTTPPKRSVSGATPICSFPSPPTVAVLLLRLDKIANPSQNEIPTSIMPETLVSHVERQRRPGLRI